MGMDIFLTIANLVLASAATWFIIWYFLMPNKSQADEESPEDTQRMKSLSEVGLQIDELESEHHHLVRLTVISTILTLPVLVMDLFDRFAPGDLPNWLINPWVQAILITPVFFYCGRGIIFDGWEAIRHHLCTPNLLATLATGIAYIFSLTTCVIGSLLPSGSRSPYFDVIGVVITLLLLAKILEVNAHASLARSWVLLAQTQPGSGQVIDPEQVEEMGTHPGSNFFAGLSGHQVAQDDIQEGDLLLVRHGERLAADGQVILGDGSIDERELVGTINPLNCEVGDHVLASTRLIQGNLIIRVEASGSDTYISKMLQVIPDALTSPSSTLHELNRKVHTFIAVIMIVAVWTLLVWLMLGPQPHLAHAVANAFCVLAIACPSISIMAIPLSFRTSLGTGLVNGVLFTSPESMKRLSRVSAVAFDNTALTDRPDPTGGVRIKEEALIRASTHLRSLKVATLVMDGSRPGERTETGKSTSAQIERAARNAGVDMLITQLTDARKEYCMDRLVHDLGSTGDNHSSDETEEDRNPGTQDKLVALALGNNGQSSLLKHAQVHISFGTCPSTLEDDRASQVSEEEGESDLILRNGDLDGIARAIELSRATRRIIKENLIWSLVYNIVALVIATGVLYPLFGWMLNPMIAPVAATIAVIISILNIRRLHHLHHLRRRWRGLAQIDTDYLPTVAARRPQIIVDSQWNPEEGQNR